MTIRSGCRHDRRTPADHLGFGFHSTAEDVTRGLGKPLDGIIANAGIMALPELTLRHGVELQCLTNHIGHFILLTELLNQLAETGRVVVLAFGTHRGTQPDGLDFDNLDGGNGYNPMVAYRNSKIANTLMVRALAKRMSGTRRTANSINPGVSGEFFADCQSQALWPPSRDDALVEQLWAHTAKTVNGLLGRS